MSMSGFKRQSLQTLTTPSSSWQQGSTSNPSTVLPGPSSILHLSPNTPSGDSPQFNPYRATLKTPTLTPNNPDGQLKPNMTAGHRKAILRKDFKKDPQLNMIFEEIHSEFYLLAVTEQMSWYDLPSPSPPTSGCLQPHLPPLHLFCLHSTPILKHTCATHTTMSCPLSD